MINFQNFFIAKFNNYTYNNSGCALAINMTLNSIWLVLKFSNPMITEFTSTTLAKFLKEAVVDPSLTFVTKQYYVQTCIAKSV